MEKEFLSKVVATDITGSYRIRAKTNVVTTRENRPYWGIAIKKDGSSRYTQDRKEFWLNSQSVIILPKGSHYTWESFGGECLILDFDADMRDYPISAFPVSNTDRLIEWFDAIEANRILKAPHYKMKNLAHLYRMLVAILEGESKKYIPHKKQDMLKPAISYITEHYNDPAISIEMLCQCTGMSYVYFRKLFSDVYNCPPMEYVSRLRMKKATEMLRGEYNSIESVAQSVGYNSIYHFSKMFKKQFGVSPTAYKNALKQ